MTRRRSSADALWRSGDLTGALDAAYALGRDPSATSADLVSAALVLMRSNHLETAESLLRRATVIAPGDVAGLSRLSRIERARGELEPALVQARRAAVAPSHRAEASHAIGQMLEVLGRAGEAENWFREAVSASGGAASHLRWLADHLLRRGAAESAWPLIHRAEIADGRTDQRLAHGLPSGEEPIVVDGDPSDLASSIYTLSRATSLAAGRPVSLSAPARLATLLRRSSPTLTIRTPDDDATEAAPVIQVGRWSLPFLLGGPIPAAPALRPDPARQAYWRTALTRQFGDRKFVGISWRSSLTLRPGAFDPPRRDRLADLDASARAADGSAARLWRKHVPLGAFRPLFSDPEIQAVSIQYGLDKAEAAYLGRKLGLPLAIPPLDSLGDLDNVASLLAALDAVVSIPNTHAHLAAALGLPTVVLCHDTPPAVWGLMRHRPHYARVAVVEKPVRRQPDGTVEHGWAGDWQDPVVRAMDAARRMMADSCESSA